MGYIAAGQRNVCYFLYEIADNDFIDCIKEYTVFRAAGRETWLLFSVWDMSLGIRNLCFTMLSSVIFL